VGRSILREDVLPLAALFAGLILATVAIDAVLHRFGMAWIGRYAGIPGSLMIVASLGYSLRKRKLIERGQPRTWLRLHEALAWGGSLLVLVHAGIHFNAVLPWLALAAMLINIISGLTGKFLLGRSGRHLASKKAHLLEQGLSAETVDSRLFWDEITIDLIRQWRTVHFPIALAFAALASGHIASILLFWGWH
jgi:hypothetical protein